MNKSQRLVKALDISLRLIESIPERESVSDDTHVQKKAKLSSEEAVSKGDSSGTTKVSSLDYQSAEIFNKIVARWNANHQVPCLAEAESLWPFYIRGILIDALGLKREEVQEKGSSVLEIFTNRLK